MLEIPMIILGFVWLILLIVELLWQLSPVLQVINTCIWALFILDFLLNFFLAPQKITFLKKNILTLISLAIPAVRIFRVARLLRAMRAIRGLRLVKVIGSLNRGMRSLSATMNRRGFSYILGLTLIVLFTGAAGMYAFENQAGTGLNSYGEALWWTAMLLISIGSDYWPQSAEGRTLCFLLSLYGFAVFGYFTATLATFFIGRDAEAKEGEIAGSKQLEVLHQEILNLRKELHQLRITRDP
jgi:voltage-gated potassium channel